MPKPRINLRLAANIYARLDEATQRPGATKSAIIEQALREYFDPEAKSGLEERILARLDAFDIRQGEIERDVGFTLEALGQFVLYWLTRTDPLPEGEREAAHALGQRRFDYFVEQVAYKAQTIENLAARFGPLRTDKKPAPFRSLPGTN